MQIKKLAICIPTYNRAAIIEETLVKSLKKYADRDWDLYIYDSSTNNDTKMVVEKYMEKFPGLFYRHIDSSVHSNLKVYAIFKEFGFVQNYEYLWVCTDSITWSDGLMNIVQMNLEFDFDLLIVNHRDVENVGTREFTNSNDLFSNCAWHMTYYGATIYKIRTMLQNVPWKYLEQRYCIPERINFSHVAYCFEKLCSLQQFRAKHLSVQAEHSRTSIMKKYEAGWKFEAFHIWCECWPDMIMALPDCYCDKELEIRKHGINSGIFLEKSILQYREEKIYTYDTFKKYQREWKNLTNVPIWKLFLISIIPAKWVKMRKFKETCRQKKLKRRIVKFTSKYSEIYLYGCGVIADMMIQHLKENNIEFNGFFVTSIQDGRTSFMNKKVQEFSPDILLNSDVGLILALGKKNTQEVMGMIRMINDKPKCGIFIK